MRNPFYVSRITYVNGTKRSIANVRLVLECSSEESIGGGEDLLEPIVACRAATK